MRIIPFGKPATMIIYRTWRGVIAATESDYVLLAETWDNLVGEPGLPGRIDKLVAAGQAGVAFNLDEVLVPLVSQEVWAAGVTYYRSRDARMAESEQAGGDSFYDRVYTAPRPELFFKASARTAVGPGEAIAIRIDASWNVPEPELVLVADRAGALIGCTVGNDVSSRDIEGENPLYLPQAKVYDRSCALGPGVVVGAPSRCRPPPRLHSRSCAPLPRCSPAPPPWPSSSARRASCSATCTETTASRTAAC